ncbi:MAG: hypothetical protein M3Z96_01220 [Pseudomonadota bacterium]|nr:hypothetical protein [Pseudomonadota bacterium]
MRNKAAELAILAGENRADRGADDAAIVLGTILSFMQNLAKKSRRDELPGQLKQLISRL